MCRKIKKAPNWGCKNHYLQCKKGVLHCKSTTYNVLIYSEGEHPTYFLKALYMLCRLL